MTTKTCTACHESKPLTEFHIRTRDDAGNLKYHAKCKPCLVAYQVDYKRKHDPKDPATLIKRRRRRRNGKGAYRISSEELFAAFAADVEARTRPPGSHAYSDAELALFVRVARYLRACERRMQEPLPPDEEPATQICVWCETERPIDEFGVKKMHTDGRVRERYKRCKQCEAAIARRREQRDAENQVKAAMSRDMQRGGE
jgi:hypothetical protein